MINQWILYSIGLLTTMIMLTNIDISSSLQDLYLNLVNSPLVFPIKLTCRTIQSVTTRCRGCKEANSRDQIHLIRSLSRTNFFIIIVTIHLQVEMKILKRIQPSLVVTTLLGQKGICTKRPFINKIWTNQTIWAILAMEESLVTELLTDLHPKFNSLVQIQSKATKWLTTKTEVTTCLKT